MINYQRAVPRALLSLFVVGKGQVGMYTKRIDSSELVCSPDGAVVVCIRLVVVVVVEETGTG